MKLHEILNQIENKELRDKLSLALDDYKKEFETKTKEKYISQNLELSNDLETGRKELKRLSEELAGFREKEKDQVLNEVIGSKVQNDTKIKLIKDLIINVKKIEDSTLLKKDLLEKKVDEIIQEYKINENMPDTSKSTLGNTSYKSITPDITNSTQSKIVEPNLAIPKSSGVL